MLVREVMSSPAVTMSASANLQAVAAAMLDTDVGSVIVTPDGDGGDAVGRGTTGIITESDVLRAARATGRPLAAIDATAAASAPLVTISPDRTVRMAVDEMIEEEIKRLIVVDGFDIVGVVTLTDIALSYSEIRSEAVALAERTAADWDQ